MIYNIAMKWLYGTLAPIWLVVSVATMFSDNPKPFRVSTIASFGGIAAWALSKSFGQQQEIDRLKKHLGMDS